jgi:hypothetical protein
MKTNGKSNLKVIVCTIRVQGLKVFEALKTKHIIYNKLSWNIAHTTNYGRNER